MSFPNRDVLYTHCRHILILIAGITGLYHEPRAVHLGVTMPTKVVSYWFLQAFITHETSALLAFPSSTAHQTSALLIFCTLLQLRVVYSYLIKL